ncbi:MAG: DNA-3-methyladenine glycosylase [Candidatus Humimicrobiaceae bacterium]
MNKKINIFTDKKFNPESYILTRSFYERDTEVVAKELLGKILLVKPQENDARGEFCAGRIVDIEAYYGANDPASHAYNGVTPRSRIMFETPGIAYVYFCYGNHYIINAVSEKYGIPGAAMIRAVEPLSGLDLMYERRKTDSLTNLSSGPGKLTMAFGINKDFNGLDLTRADSKVIIIDASKLNLIPGKEKTEIISCPRIGIKNGADKLLRFYIKGNNFASHK